MNKKLFKNKLQRISGFVATDDQLNTLIEIIRPSRDLMPQDILDRGFYPCKHNSNNEYSYRNSDLQIFNIVWHKELGLFILNGHKYFFRDYLTFDCIMTALNLPIMLHKIEPRDAEKQDFINLGFESCGEEYGFSFYSWKGFTIGFNFETQILTGVGDIEIKNQLHLTEILHKEIFLKHGKK